MSFIKKNSTILVIVLALVVFVGGFFYYSLVLTPQLETLQDLSADIEEKDHELQHLQEEFKVLGKRKIDLKDINMQTRSLEEKIPTYEVAIIMMTEIMQYTDIYNFDNKTVSVGNTIENDEEGRDYDTIPVTIKYTTTYEDSVKFLEMINRSYQMVTMDRFVIDNAIQEAGAEEGMPFTVSKDTVETELILHMHFKGTGESEVYPNFMEYLEKEENIFQRPTEFNLDDFESLEGERPEGSQTDPTTDANMQTKTRLNIHLADILRSGDNYTFNGYSPDQEPLYVGLTSSKDTRMVLTIRDNSYTCLIEDAEGNKSEKSVDTRVVNPSVNITSQIQNVMEVMPTASIHVRNYTAGVINVNMRGTSLENVRIYNENNELVVPGTQSGKIAVTR